MGKTVRLRLVDEQSGKTEIYLTNGELEQDHLTYATTEMGVRLSQQNQPRKRPRTHFVRRQPTRMLEKQHDEQKKLICDTKELLYALVRSRELAAQHRREQQQQGTSGGSRFKTALKNLARPQHPTRNFAAKSLSTLPPLVLGGGGRPENLAKSLKSASVQ